MKRLLKTAENGTIKDILNLIERIKQSNEDLKSAYFVLFDNLNAIANGYPAVYDAIKQDVKLPENNEVHEIIDLYNHLNEILPLFLDETYLKSFLSPEQKENNLDDKENDLGNIE